MTRRDAADGFFAAFFLVTRFFAADFRFALAVARRDVAERAAFLRELVLPAVRPVLALAADFLLAAIGSFFAAF